VFIRQHPRRGLLRHQKPPKRADRDGLGASAATKSTNAPRAGHWRCRRPRRALRFRASTSPNRRSTSSGSVALQQRRARRLAAERAKLFDLARRQRDTEAFAGKQPRHDATQALAGADNKAVFVFGFP